MTADHAFDETFTREPVKTALLAVTGCRGEDEGQVLRRASLIEAARQREDQFVRRTDADKA